MDEEQKDTYYNDRNEIQMQAKLAIQKAQEEQHIQYIKYIKKKEYEAVVKVELRSNNDIRG